MRAGAAAATAFTIALTVAIAGARVAGAQTPSPPSPAPPSPHASATAPRLTITCPRTPLWTFATGADVPSRAREPDVTLGQRFGYLGSRTTLGGIVYDQTDIVAVEPDLLGTHYWVLRSCASRS